MRSLGHRLELSASDLASHLGRRHLTQVNVLIAHAQWQTSGPCLLSPTEAVAFPRFVASSSPSPGWTDE
jgi:hypothetical protein